MFVPEAILGFQVSDRSNRLSVSTMQGSCGVVSLFALSSVDFGCVLKCGCLGSVFAWVTQCVEFGCVGVFAWVVCLLGLRSVDFGCVGVFAWVVWLLGLSSVLGWCSGSTPMAISSFMDEHHALRYNHGQ